MKPSHQPVTVTVVTDPMCSWCWGMAQATDEARAALEGEVVFELLLGGINTDSTQPVGAYGERLMLKLWAEVAATTGAPFNDRLPKDYVHNSTLPCLALETARQVHGAPPFDLLHALQRAFFVDGVNINNHDALARCCGEFAELGLDAQTLAAGLQDSALQQRLRFQFDAAKSFGTHALPSVLIETDGTTRLLAGGYLDSAMWVELVRGAI